MSMTTHTPELITVDERAIAQRLFDFALVLRAADAMSSDEDEYWERPWKWANEYALWVEAGSPAAPETGDPVSLSWGRFLRALANEETGR